MTNEILFDLEERPYGKSWEKWAADWCKWLLSIPRPVNPNLDTTGESCSQHQSDPNVWFLAATFGNIIPVYRTCHIPKEKAIFFSILEKEDSFAESENIKDEADLLRSVKDFMDNKLFIGATLDGKSLENLTSYRVQSEVFDLVFPDNPVYDGVKPGKTRAACNGYWIFIKPLRTGQHELHFTSEIHVRMNKALEQLLNDSTFSPIKDHIVTKFTFKLDVTYNLIVQ